MILLTAGAEPGRGRVDLPKAKNLNLRAGPDTSYPSIFLLAQGTEVSLTGKSEGDWIEVRSGQATGWVYSEFIAFDEKETVTAAFDRLERLNSGSAQPTAPQVPCPPTQETARSGSGLSLLDGLRKSMRTLYQSCDATKIVVSQRSSAKNGVIKTGESTRTLPAAGRSTYTQAHPVLRKLSELQGEGRYPGAGCRNVLDAPVIYAFGAKPTVAKGRIATFTDLSKHGSPGNGIDQSSSAVTGVDCSGFVSMAMAAAGLKCEPDQRDKMRTLGTWAIAGFDDKSCFQTPELTLKQSLQPGDVINLAGNHVIVIDEVGEDPLGVGKVLQAKRNCDSMTAADFNFVYSHSGDIGDYGVVRVSSRYHATGRSTLMNNLVAAAKSLCRNAQESVLPSGGPKFKILRHVTSIFPAPSSAARCRFSDSERLKLDGEECVRGC